MNSNVKVKAAVSVFELLRAIKEFRENAPNLLRDEERAYKFLKDVVSQLDYEEVEILLEVIGIKVSDRFFFLLNTLQEKIPLTFREEGFVREILYLQKRND